MVSNLLAMASNVLVMASNLRAMVSPYSHGALEKVVTLKRSFGTAKDVVPSGVLVTRSKARSAASLLRS